MLMCLSIANVSLGIALQFACVFILGAGKATDAYFAAQTLPGTIGAILSGALIFNLTPVAAGIESIRADAFVRAVISQFALVALALFGIMGCTAVWWAPAIFPGFSGDSDQLLVTLAQIACINAGLQAFSAIGIAGHHARHEFLFVEIVHLLTTVAILAGAVPIIQVFGIIGFAMLQLARNLVILIVTSFRYMRAQPAAVHDLTSALWRKARRLLSTSVVFKLGSVVDRMLASFSPSGVITSLGVGQQLATASLGITDRVLSRPFLANAGTMLSSDAKYEVLQMYYRQVRIFLLVAGMGCLLLVPVMFILPYDMDLYRGMRLDMFGIPDLIILMTLTVIPAALGQLSSSLMYALGDVATISRIALTSFFLSTLLKIIGYMHVGAYAIIAGVFLYQSFNWYFLHRAATRTLQYGQNLK